MDRDSRLIFEAYKQKLNENALAVGGAVAADVALKILASIAVSFGLVETGRQIMKIGETSGATQVPDMTTQRITVIQKITQDLSAAAEAQDFDKFLYAGEQASLLMQDAGGPLGSFFAGMGSIIFKSLQGFYQTGDLIYFYACARALNLGFSQMAGVVSQEGLSKELAISFSEAATLTQNIANQLVDQFGNPIQSPQAGTSQQTQSTPGAPTPPGGPSKWDKTKDLAKKGAKIGAKIGYKVGKDILNGTLYWGGQAITGSFKLLGLAGVGGAALYKKLGMLGSIGITLAALIAYLSWQFGSGAAAGVRRAGEKAGEAAETTADAAKDVADTTKAATQATEDLVKTGDQLGRGIPGAAYSLWSSIVGFFGGSSETPETPETPQVPEIPRPVPKPTPLTVTPNSTNNTPYVAPNKYEGFKPEE